MKNTNKLLSIILAILMIVTTVPFAFAAETPVAKIGDVEYTDFDEALANWVDGTTLTLLDNVSYDITIDILDKSVVLDLNGKTLDVSASRAVRVYAPGELTIKDSNEGGTLKGETNSATVYDTLNLESGNLINRIYNMGTTNISGGRVIGEYQGLQTGRSSSVFNISGGEIIGNTGMWINGGVVNISGSPKITGTKGYAIQNFDNAIINITGTPVLTGTKGDIYECYHENVNRISSNGDNTHKMICFCGSNNKDVDCSGGIATCKDKAVCEICGAEYGDVDEDNHKDTLVQVEAKAPTCTEIGWEAYEYCTACDYSTYEEKAILDHADEDGDSFCDNGGEQLTCEDCGRPVHGDTIVDKFVCWIVMLFNLIKSIF